MSMYRLCNVCTRYVVVQSLVLLLVISLSNGKVAVMIYYPHSNYSNILIAQMACLIKHPELQVFLPVLINRTIMWYVNYMAGTRESFNTAVRGFHQRTCLPCLIDSI